MKSMIEYQGLWCTECNAPLNVFMTPEDRHSLWDKRVVCLKCVPKCEREDEEVPPPAPLTG